VSEQDQPGIPWPLGWRCLDRDVAWSWWEQLWKDAKMLRDRYRLALRSGWWEDEIQVEALAALAAWSRGYDTGAWTDPPGKLQLLYDLDRIRGLLRAGENVFDPGRDRTAFVQHLLLIGCEPPGSTPESPGREPRNRVRSST
jgi:hypothetical protein